MEYLVLLAFLFMAVAIVLSRSRSAVSCVQVPEQTGRTGNVGKGGKKIFLWGLGVRLVALLALLASGAIKSGISRDSLKYHETGIAIAARMRQGDYDWANWIDNGWYQFTGFVYHLVGESMLLIQLLNIVFGAATGYLAYRIAVELYENEAIARFSGYLTALFPSFVYFSVLPLKDTASLFSLLLIVFSVVKLRSEFGFRYLMTLSIALTIILGLRDYLFFICLAFVLLSLAPVSQRRVFRYLTMISGIIILLGSLAYAFGFGFLGLDFVQSAKYFDLDYINYTRQQLNRGTGSFYDNPTSARWGQGFFNDVMNALSGIYFFFFSIDPTEVGRSRQFFALPEMLLVLIGLPALVTGVLRSWTHCRDKALPVIIFAFGVMAVYSSATTNMGAMFRWRMQSLPFFLIMLGYGVYLRRKGVLFRLMRRMSS